MIEYSDYKSLVNILNESNKDNAYQDIMAKETKSLDTINNIIKYYRDNNIKQQEFINQSLYQVIYDFYNTMNQMFNEAFYIKKYNDIIILLTKDNRLIYLGILLIILSIFLYFIDITK